MLDTNFIEVIILAGLLIYFLNTWIICDLISKTNEVILTKARWKFLLVACFPLPFASCPWLFPGLLVDYYFFLGACYFLFLAHCFLLVARYFMFVACYILLVACSSYYVYIYFMSNSFPFWVKVNKKVLHINLKTKSLIYEYFKN